MRLIDADSVPYTMLYKENWMRCSGIEAQGAWKSDIDKVPTVKAIPIEWIVDWLAKQHIPAAHTCDDYYAVEMMLDEWEEENGLS